LDSEVLNHYLPVTTTTPGGLTNVPGQNWVAHHGDDHSDHHGEAEFGTELTGAEWNTYDKAIADEVRTLGDRTVTYDCSDYSSNSAAQRTREIKTVDSTKPTITLTHKGINTPGETDVVEYIAHSSDTDVLDLSDWSAVAEDSCDASVNVQQSWGETEFNAKKIGHYIRTYTATDISGNTATKTRTFSVVDTALPIIQPVGFAEGTELLVTMEASRDVQYTDKGATCSDFVDGELTHAVETSGEVVNMRVPGTYHIRYDCQDLSGNNAISRTRTVVVEDITNPTIDVIGSEVNYVEAGFPYVDAGATATDTLDGDLTNFIWTSGDTVNYDVALSNFRSCQQINKQFCTLEDCSENAHAPDGAYHIINANGDKMGVNCYFYHTDASHGNVGFTYHLHTARDSKPDCASYGMEKFTPETLGYDKLIETLPQLHPEVDIGDLEDYVCYVHDESKLHVHNIAPEEALTAGAGVYKIRYHVQDKAGNYADSTIRSVIVQDTLPPVITLKLQNKLVSQNHNGVPTTRGIGHMRTGGLLEADYPTTHNVYRPVASADPAVSGRSAASISATFNQQYNPAEYKVGDPTYTSTPGYAGFGNPNLSLMAESASSVNGWIVGAVASAVAGVALLGLSSRKTAASVPV